jgi:hypothetical protein
MTPQQESAIHNHIDHVEQKLDNLSAEVKRLQQTFDLILLRLGQKP